MCLIKALNNRLVWLRGKHAELHRQVESLSKRVGSGSFDLAHLKQKKLRIKEEIVEIEGRLKSLQPQGELAEAA